MNGPQIHLMLNHIPVIAIPLSFVLLAMGRRVQDHRLQKWAVAFMILIALLTLPVFFSGEPAQHALKGLPGVDSPRIDPHEDWGEAAFAAVETLGGLALLGLVFFRRRDRFPSAYIASLLLAGLVSSALLAWTAHLGGLIRHPELGSSPPTADIYRVPASGDKDGD